ncbi:glutathione S-transferase family protein [Novosphingobium album (ex Liu et al. 2023)]|uniref:Glutathione S-transferase family protein n=1 Tax=Novosphingobium album (ex Liu et al. 2023) TaxID=3031130 RepID=A0ABT5WVJ8_9SPHN|nr:glutathione S-transferase family protein [Novosphingobium album (ex Liu et al. 2023)]MDE8653908.1 glutathione S-transferase family protein [Novosphingobium album (ex Liu et al. 2023)]
MKIFTAANSNFGARVAIAARAKGIDLEEATPPQGGLRSETFLAINPVAKIPVLMLDDGVVLPESDTILRYLDAQFPLPGLYPVQAGKRALVERASRFMDYYVMAPVIRLFPHLNPATRDPNVVESEISRWRDGLATLAHFMREPLPEAPAGVSFADCVLAPSLHLCTRIAAMLGLPNDPVTEHDALVAYCRAAARHPVIGPVLESLTHAQEAKDLQSDLPSLVARHRAITESPISEIR